MIKLVCSDLDGTLIQYGDKGMSEEIFEQIKALSAYGIPFCPASGRQFYSQKNQFEAVGEHCLFICENGGVLCDHTGKVLGKTVIPRAVAEQIAWDMWERTDGLGEIMMSGEKTAYLMCRELTKEQRGGNYSMLERIRFIGNRYRIVRTPSEVPEDITKVSVFISTGVAPYAERFVSQWKEYNCAIAGPFWIDTTAANKGSGVRLACDVLGITPDEVLAFGDNYNDVPMLDTVGRGYIMDSAVPELRSRYPLHTPHPEIVLREVLRELETKQSICPKNAEKIGLNLCPIYDIIGSERE